MSKKFGLSLPFFIKYDDVEYCIRACKNIVLLNGVGVWHEAFDIKSTSDLEYYHRRNELILASIYSPKQNAFSYFRKLIFETAKLLVCMKYQRPPAMLPRATGAFLRAQIILTQSILSLYTRS